MGKILITIGVLLVAAGLVIHYYGRIPFFGKLPGDIAIEKPNFKFYFPITSSIIISILLSAIFYLIQKLKN